MRRNNKGRIFKRTNESVGTTKESTRQASSRSTKLLERAGYMSSFGSGLYGLTSFGQKTRRRVQNVIESHLISDDWSEVTIPSLQYADDWRKSGRWEKFEGEMFTFVNRDDKDMCLAPTHEEGIVRMFRPVIRSYKELPVRVYQIKEKHRDDRARNGLLRGKEFVMKDAYSIHESSQRMMEQYEDMRKLYSEIFEDLGLNVFSVESDVGVMGGSKSLEFVAPSESGDDELIFCSDCGFARTDESSDFEDYDAGQSCPECSGEDIELTDGVEVGHIFALGQRYSSRMDFEFDTDSGGQEAVHMASYGIGVTRVIQTLVEQHSTKKSCNWPVTDTYTPAPFDTCLIRKYGIESSIVRQVRDAVRDSGLTCLDYNSDRNMGEQFSESELIGIPVKIVLGNNWVDNNQVEVEFRDGSKRFCEINELEDELSSYF